MNWKTTLAILLLWSAALPDAPAQSTAPAAQAAYVLSPGDRVIIRVLEDESFSRTYTVSGQGTVELPMVGPVVAAGLAPAQLAERVKQALEKDLFYKTTVTAQMGEFTEGQVYIFGEVQNPRSIQLSEARRITVVEAIAMAGGLRQDAQRDEVIIYRWQPGVGGMNRQAIKVPLATMLATRDMNQDVYLQTKDVVYVPGPTGRVYVIGQVRNPGVVVLPFDERLTVGKAIIRSGGLAQFANDAKVKLVRRKPDGTQQVIEVDVRKILKEGDLAGDVPVQHEDMIIVPERLFNL